MDFFNLEFFSDIPAYEMVGSLGIIFALIANCQKKDAYFLNITILSFCFWVAHFSMIEEYNTAIVFILVAARIFLSQLYFQNFRVMNFFMFLTIIQAFYFVKTPHDLFPIAVGFISSFANFMYRDIELRILILFCALLMLFNAYFVNSGTGMIAETINIIILSYTIRRMHQNESKKINFNLPLKTPLKVS
jgi:hypothetical protein